MEYILEGLQAGIAQMTLLEAIAVVFGLASVWYARLENILVYPTGIVSVLIYVYICFGAKLYADMGINAYYFVMSVYGWIVWSKKVDSTHHIPITRNSLSENITALGIMVVSFFVLRYVLINFTDSDVPIWDSATTSIFFVGMWLMARKIKAMGIKMVLSGEGSDEIFGGYLYFHKAPNAQEFHEETVRKLQQLHLFDCLRANKSMAAWGV
ncbi:MAG: nicotinamide riboside transporter PnuC, partial [Bacteroidota bacterium]